MKAMLRLFIVIGLYLGLMHGASGRQVVSVDTIVESNKDAVKISLIKSIKIDGVLWLITQVGPRYYVYTVKDSGQLVSHTDIRNDGTVITVRQKGGDETTFFVPELRLSSKFFEINWKKITEDEIMKEAKAWNLRV